MRGMRLLAILMLLTGARGVSADPLPDLIELAVGETRALDISLRRAALGSGKVVSLATPEKGQLLLFGEAEGRTTLQLWLADGSRKAVQIQVTAGTIVHDFEQVRALLDGMEGIRVRIAGSHILMEGDRVSLEDRERGEQVAAMFPGRVLNFVGREGWESMVQLDVRLVEIRRDQLRQLGLRWAAQSAGPTLSLEGGGGAGGLSMRAEISAALQSQIDLLQQRGMAFVVAEPTLSCRSGGSARFVSGGEVPIPVTDGLGATDVQYKEYGVILEVHPRADRSDAIYADVDIELSQLDASVRSGDYPGFVKRRTRTAFNVRSGQTIAIAGLVAHERSRDRQGLPGLSAIPLMGSLFASSRRQSRQTELLVLITPRRFIPADSSDTSGTRDQAALIERADFMIQSGGTR